MSTNVEFDLQRHLADMEKRQTDYMTDRFDKLEQKFDAVEVRVRNLENWRNYLAGAWVVITAGWGYVIKGQWAKP